MGNGLSKKEIERLTRPHKPFINGLGLAQIIVLVLTVAIGLVSYLYIQKVEVEPSHIILFIFSLIYGVLGFYILVALVAIFELIATIIQIVFAVKYAKWKKEQKAKQNQINTETLATAQETNQSQNEPKIEY